METIGLIGLGKMGSNLIQNIKKNGYNPIGYDVNQDALSYVKNLDITVANNVKELIIALPKPRYVMLLVPAGKITHVQIQELLALLEPGDVILDAGNSFYQETLLHAKQAQKKGLSLLMSEPVVGLMEL